MKVCESYPGQRILYRKTYISDPLHQRCQYFGEVTAFTVFFFDNFLKNVWINCQSLDYNLVSWIFLD